MRPQSIYISGQVICSKTDLTHLVWPHRSVRKPTREAQGSADQSMKKPGVGPP